MDDYFFFKAAQHETYLLPARLTGNMLFTFSATTLKRVSSLVHANTCSHASKRASHRLSAQSLSPNEPGQSAISISIPRAIGPQLIFGDADIQAMVPFARYRQTNAF